MRRVRFHPATFFNDSVDCLEQYPGLDPPYVNYDNCVYPVGTSIFKYSKVLLSDLPKELLLEMMLLLSPKDIRNMSQTCRSFNKFVTTFFQSLPRQVIQKMVIQTYRPEDDTFSMKLIRPFNKTGYLWASYEFDWKMFPEFDKDMDIAFRCQLASDSTIDLHDVVFTDRSLLKLKQIIVEMVFQGYPCYRTKQPFRLRLYGCSFSNTQKSTFKGFVDTMIDSGMKEFHMNNVKFRDVKSLCSELGKTKLYLLTIFRFHSVEIVPSRTQDIAKLLKPFYKSERCTKKIVIDGFEMPLDLCCSFMINFCCTPFFTVMPPPLRVVMGIHRQTSRDDLYSLLTVVRNDINAVRSSIRHRLNHVFLELGLYDSERYSSQLNHCVLDVNLLRNRSKLKELDSSIIT